jgi:WD40 repeat protein
VEVGVSTQGFRSLAVSSDGKYLSAGDYEGNLHIYDLQTSDYTCFQVKPRHLDAILKYLCKNKAM